MRIAPVGWAFESEQEVLATAEVSASCTPNHPKGIKRAQATALCIFLARQGHTSSAIQAQIERISVTSSRFLSKNCSGAIRGKAPMGKMIVIFVKIVCRKLSFARSRLRTLRMRFAMLSALVEIVTPLVASPKVLPKPSTAYLRKSRNKLGSIWMRPSNTVRSFIRKYGI